MAGYATPAWTNNSAPAINAAAMTNIGQGIEIAEHPYGVCSTAAATAAKTVTIDFSGTLSLFTGLTVRVKFSNGNTAASPTLNVNSTGAKSIVYGNSFAAGSGWTAGAILELTYDGTNWVTGREAAVDTKPASGSSHLITSGGVYNGFAATVNPNLIDNWYFVQLANTGYFPINQRGSQTSWNGAAVWTIDRWGLFSSNTGGGKVEITANGIKLTKGSTNLQWGQAIPMSYLVGKKLTYSMLIEVTSGGIGFSIGETPSPLQNYYGRYNGSQITTSGLVSETFQFDTINNINNYANIVLNQTAASSVVTIKAVKLEYGDHQTLCRNENGTWVLNEIPNYSDQLARCQRYYIKLPEYERIRASLVSTNIQFFVPTPVPMATLSETTGLVGTPVVQSLNGTNQTGFTFYTYTYPNGVRVTATKTSHGMTDATLHMNGAAFFAGL